MEIFKNAITNFFFTDMILCGTGATEFDQMINLPKDLRKKLNEKYIISTGEVVKDTLSNDGTRKWLINFGGQEVESKSCFANVFKTDDIY
jgi:adenine C2-methylase RlmN of 23S rRNA A2503 and tRNA A37